MGDSSLTEQELRDIRVSLRRTSKNDETTKPVPTDENPKKQAKPVSLRQEVSAVRELCLELYFALKSMDLLPEVQVRLLSRAAVLNLHRDAPGKWRKIVERSTQEELPFTGSRASGPLDPSERGPSDET